MRNVLMWINRMAAGAAGLLLVLIAVLTLVQISARAMGLAAHSWDEVGAFCMAGATFMGLAYTWRTQGHIRMTLAVSRLSGRARYCADTFALIVMFACSLYVAGFLFDMAYLSWEMNDVSQGLVPMPLWVPQSVMGIGAALLALAVGETLYDVGVRRQPLADSSADDALQQAKGEV